MNLSLTLFLIVSYIVGNSNIGFLLKRIKLLTNVNLINYDFKFIFRRANLISYGLIIMFELLVGLILTKIAGKTGFNSFEIGLIILVLFLGHNFPIVKFDKNYYTHGSALIIGAFASLGWTIMIISVFLWLIALLIFGYRRLATLFLFIFLPIYVWVFFTEYTLTASILSSLLIIFSTKEITEIIKDIRKPDIYGVLQYLIKYDDDIV